MACVTGLDVLGRKAEVVETCFRGDLDAFGAGFTEHGNGFNGGKMNNVELELGGEVGERENFGNGVGFEGWRTRVEEGRVVIQGPGGSEGWVGALDIVTD